MTQETTHWEPSGLRARLQATRNDERGIALQTVIIMVVLLAIAGGIAAVLLTRAQSATDQLEAQSFSADLSTMNKTFCQSSGYYWDTDDSGDDHCQISEGVPTALQGDGSSTITECRNRGLGFDATDKKCTDGTGPA